MKCGALWFERLVRPSLFYSGSIFLEYQNNAGSSNGSTAFIELLEYFACLGELSSLRF